MAAMTNFTVCLWVSQSYRKYMAKKSTTFSLYSFLSTSNYTTFSVTLAVKSWNTICYKAILIEHTKCLFSENVKDFLLNWQYRIFSQSPLWRKIYILTNVSHLQTIKLSRIIRKRKTQIIKRGNWEDFIYYFEKCKTESFFPPKFLNAKCLPGKQEPRWELWRPSTLMHSLLVLCPSNISSLSYTMLPVGTLPRKWKLTWVPSGRCSS